MRIIANPLAGHGRGELFIGQLPALLREVGLKGDIVQTRTPRHATQLAREAVEQGCRLVVAMGGDGTATEVADGLLGSNAVLGLISIGTGNDLARTLKLPINRLKPSLEILRRRAVREIDVGWEGDRCFLSVMGIGYPALVAEETNRLQWLKGPPSFFLSVYKALRRMEVVPVEVVLDDRRLEVGCTSILIHNTPYTGGGLKIAPMAQLDDGYLDVVVIDSVGKLDLMWNFPRVYRGTHLNHPNFQHYRSRKVSVTSRTQVRKMRDGDPAGRLPMEATILPRALKVVGN